MMVATSVATSTVTPMLTSGITAMAASDGYHVVNGVVNLGRGSASITIRGNVGQSLENKKFEVMKLFDAENAEHGESINYTFNPVYKTAIQTVVATALNKRDGSSLSPANITEYLAIDYIQTLNTNQVEGCYTGQTLEGRYSAFRYFVEDVRNEIKREKIYSDIIVVDGVSATNAVQISGLQYGYYLVDEISEKDSEGEDWFASSLCAVNTANPVAQIQIKSDYPEIIKKIQEDDNKDALGNDGWNDIGDYEIGQTVPFKYESTIANMNGYHSYYYAWHDSMDKELTFHSNKSEISIVISDGNKSYKVKDSEYNVITSGTKLDIEDTFMLEIPDIKKIIDKQFNKVNSLGENDYSNLSVTVNYVATLNDKAAANTGRPGFENDVRLEFSNDPDRVGQGMPGGKDETGYTPWDTVVCFTYKLNGLKTNNYDRVLSGAEFKLYSDAECTNEVYVKAMGSGVATLSEEGEEVAAFSEDTYETVEEEVPSDAEEVDTPEADEGVSTASTTSNKAIYKPTDVGVTDNVTNPTDKEVIGNNGYIVINRDCLGGTDHTGGDAPSEAVTMVSDKDGNFTIYGLDQGTYYLKEVKAPAGYRCLLDPIVINIKPAFTSNRQNYVAGTGATDDVLKSLKATGHIKEFYEGHYLEGDANLVTDLADGSVNLKVINEVGSKLPVTGSSSMIFLVGVGVLLVGGAVFVKVRGKKKES